MTRRSQAKFAEVRVGELFLAAFPNERSAYYRTPDQQEFLSKLNRFRGKLTYHIKNSLSPRQKQVITLYLLGKKEREMAQILGITQQVVNIYKHRAIRKLHDLLTK